jgi:hypothetical protein
MLKSYEAIYENGQLTWVSEQPQINTARVIVTILEETSPSTKRRTPPASIFNVVRGLPSQSLI